jgi:putative Ig domain-containing protein/fibronectin type III domain protein
MNRHSSIWLTLVVTIMMLGCGIQPSSSLQVATSSLPSASVLQTYSVKLATFGGTPPFKWNIISGQLPPGLSLSPDTGDILGTPVSSGDFSFTVQVSDSTTLQGPQAASKSLQVKVGRSSPVITTTNLPVAQSGISYAATLTASGGNPPYTWSVVSGSLPPGLALDASAGQVLGVPTQAGSFPFMIQVKDGSNRTGTKGFNISVTSPPSPLVVNTNSLPDGTAQVQYGGLLSASGGLAPYSWSLTAGALPPGLALGSSTGAIAGTPSAAGQYSFTVQVQDSAVPPQTAAKPLAITIAPDPPPGPPAAPSGLSATAASSSQINLGWTETSSNVDGFKIERCQGAGCTNFAQIAQTGPSTTSFVDSGLASGTTYSYRVRAFNSGGNSAYSNTASATTTTQLPSPPAAPTNLTATAGSSSQINLGWVDNSTNEDGFYIERCQGAGCANFVQIAQTGPKNTGFIDSGLAGGTTYAYRVRAFNSGGNSAYSNTASATTQSASPPAAPINLAANAASSSEIDLSWTETGTNVDGFKIERCAGTGCASFVQVAQLASNTTSFSDTGVSANTTYDYRVRAFNASGNSAYSNVAEATTPGPPSTNSLLAGMTPSNLTVPSGWALAATQDFEGSIPAGQEIIGTGITTTQFHSGGHSLFAHITGDGSTVKWLLHNVAATEYYISFWEYDDANASMGGDYFFFHVFKASPYQEIVVDGGDGNLQPGYISPTDSVVLVSQGQPQTDFADWAHSGTLTLGLGRWVQYEFWMRGNSCTGGVPNNDGFYRMYVNGVLFLEHIGLNLTGCPTFNGANDVTVAASGTAEYGILTSGTPLPDGTCPGCPCLDPQGGPPNNNQAICPTFSACQPFRADNPSLTCWGSQQPFNRYIDDIIVLRK